MTVENSLFLQREIQHNTVILENLSIIWCVLPAFHVVLTKAN